MSVKVCHYKINHDSTVRNLSLKGALNRVFTSWHKNLIPSYACYWVLNGNHEKKIVYPTMFYKRCVKWYKPNFIKSGEADKQATNKTLQLTSQTNSSSELITGLQVGALLPDMCRDKQGRVWVLTHHLFSLATEGRMIRRLSPRTTARLDVCQEKVVWTTI